MWYNDIKYRLKFVYQIYFKQWMLMTDCKCKLYETKLLKPKINY